MKGLLFISSSPHIRSEDDVNGIMWRVNIALLPALMMAVYVFGLRALVLTVVSAAAAVATEYLIEKIFKLPITITDGSALMTGILLAYNVPPTLPLWMVATGSVFAIAIAKMAFGGLGKNIFNPALIGRAFLLASYPVQMTTWTIGSDAVTTATPLGVAKVGIHKIINNGNLYQHFGGQATLYKDLFFGTIGGSIGEISAAALLLGAIYLFYKKIITWHIPTSFLLTLGVFVWIFGGDSGTYFTGDYIFHILAGGAILGAFFMATDMVATPLTNKGQLIFGSGCGLITAIIRIWGGYPEGVSYSILIMDAFVPLIDRYTKPKIFGSRT